MPIFTLDGRSYNVGISNITRAATIKDGENAGDLKSGRYSRDVVGTYWVYKMDVDTIRTTPEEYDQFYQRLTEPIESHIVTFPYGQSVLTFEAYIEDVDDKLLFYGKPNRWGKMKITFKAIEPVRRA